MQTTSAAKTESLERIASWIEKHKTRLRGRVREYHTLMENFYITCPNPTMEAYYNFARDIRFYNRKDQQLLIQGFLFIYNTTPAALELHSMDDDDPRRN